MVIFNSDINLKIYAGSDIQALGINLRA